MILAIAENPAARVDRGAKVLDEQCPGWWRQIDSDKLDIGHSENCVIGQLFGSFSKVSKLGFGFSASRHGMFPLVNSYGWDSKYPKECRQLTELWKIEIDLRLRGIISPAPKIRNRSWFVEKFRNLFREPQLSPG